MLWSIDMSANSPITKDYSKTFTFYHDRVERDPLSWVVKIPGQGIAMTSTEWCRKNCTSKWAWWFDQDNCYLGFENYQEYNWFKIVHID